MQNPPCPLPPRRAPCSSRDAGRPSPHLGPPFRPLHIGLGTVCRALRRQRILKSPATLMYQTAELHSAPATQTLRGVKDLLGLVSHLSEALIHAHRSSRLAELLWQVGIGPSSWAGYHCIARVGAAISDGLLSGADLRRRYVPALELHLPFFPVTAQRRLIPLWEVFANAEQIEYLLLWQIPSDSWGNSFLCFFCVVRIHRCAQGLRREVSVTLGALALLVLLTGRKAFPGSSGFNGALLALLGNLPSRLGRVGVCTCSLIALLGRTPGYSAFFAAWGCPLSPPGFAGQASQDHPGW